MDELIPVITFGDRMRRLRLTLNLTQDEFAEQIGLSSATIGKYELLERPTRSAKHVAATIQLRYGVPRTWLLDGLPRQDSNLEPVGLSTQPEKILAEAS